MKLPKISKRSIGYMIAVIAWLLLVYVALSSMRPAPLDAYITQRNCQFVEFAGIHAAACDDGSAWLVSPLNP